MEHRVVIIRCLSGLGIALALGVTWETEAQDFVRKGREAGPAESTVVASVRQAIAAEIQTVPDDRFHEWLFGGLNAAAERTFLESLLRLKIEDAGEVCGLSEAQRKKLELAGQVDIRRLLEQAEEFKVLRGTVRFNRDLLDQLVGEIQKLRLKTDYEMTDPRSFYAKTLRATLTPEQSAVFLRVDFERRSRRYPARVESTVASLDALLKLTGDQRDRLTRLLRDATCPPLAYGPYDSDAVMAGLANLPEPQVRSVLDAEQWQLLQPRIKAARVVEPFLRDVGLLAECPAEAAPVHSDKNSGDR